MTASQRLRGVFAVLQTPVDEAGALDEESLRNQVRFCVEMGVHGVVYPVLAGEFQFLGDEERHRMVEAVTGEAGGRIPVVVGVAAPSTPQAARHAAHAAQAGADAVIALPPYIARGSLDEIRGYYQAIADAAQMPVFIQDAAPGLPIGVIMELLTEIEHVRYVKEENEPSAHNISALVTGLGDVCWGVFGGGHSRWMMSELHRGAAGFMPSVEIADIHAQIWDLYQAGDETGARRMFNQVLPLINMTLSLRMPLVKEVLLRRGIIRTAAMRMPGTHPLDDEDRRELDMVLAGIERLFAG